MAEVLGAEANESRICSEALDDEGYVLGYPDATTKKVAKCAAGGKAYGIAYKSTKNIITGTAEADKAVAIIRAPKKAKVKAYTDASAIAAGDLVSMKGAVAAGCVKKHSWTVWAAATGTEMAMVVGIAQEALAASTQGKIEVLLMCPLPIMQ